MFLRWWDTSQAPELHIFCPAVQRPRRASSAAREKKPATRRSSPKETSPFRACYVEARLTLLGTVPALQIDSHLRCKAKSKLPGDQKLNDKKKSFSKAPTKEQSIMGCGYQQLLLPPAVVVEEGELWKEVGLQIPCLY